MPPKIKITVRKEEFGTDKIDSPIIEDSHKNKFFIYTPETSSELSTMGAILRESSEEYGLKGIAGDYFWDTKGKSVFTVVNKHGDTIAMALTEIVSVTDKFNIHPPDKRYNDFSGKGMGIIYQIHYHRNISDIDPDCEVRTQGYGALSYVLFKFSKKVRTNWLGTVAELDAQESLSDKVIKSYRNLFPYGLLSLPTEHGTILVGLGAANPELLPMLKETGIRGMYSAVPR